MKMEKIMKVGHVDSPAKKLVRLHVFETAANILKKRFFEGCHLGLASREAGDYSVLGGMGVPSENIVLAEHDKEAFEDAKARWGYALDVRNKDILEVAKEYPYCFAHINFDTCAPIRHQHVYTLQELVTWHIETNGLVTAWFLAGREQDEETMQDVRVMEDLLRDALKESREEIMGLNRYPMEVLDERLPYLARAFVLEHQLSLAVHKWNKYVKVVRIWTYNSEDKLHGKLGSPMFVMMMRVLKSKPVIKSFADELLPAIKHDHFILKGDMRGRMVRRAIALSDDGKPAELLLNAHGSLPAWRAHVTRGTYG